MKLKTWSTTFWLLCVSCVSSSFVCAKSIYADHSTNQGKAVINSAEFRDIISETILANLKHRSLSNSRNAAWQIIHGVVAYGEQLPLEVEGKSVAAIDYLFQKGNVRGWEVSLGEVLATSNRNGVVVKVDPGSYVGQGHPDQWLGYFSQANIPLDTPIQVQGKSMQLKDMALQSQWSVPNNPHLEYSWTLIALTNYFPDVKEWTASDGKTWTLEPLVEFEANQDLGSSACGGMHRLMGLAHAIRYRERQKELLNGPWAMAKKVVDNSINAAKEFQNSDGSFSTNYTRRPGTSVDLSLSISATGHTLEFLAFALDKKELSQAWMERAVLRLCAMLNAAQDIDLECGGVYHALAGLRLYQKRRFE